MFSKLTLLVLLAMSSVSFSAEKLDWKKCAAEVKEYKCSGDDKAIYECLEKHDDKLGKSCQETHALGDKMFGKK